MELAAEGRPGLARLTAIAIDPALSSDVRILATNSLPLTSEKSELEQVARAFFQSDDPVLRIQGIFVCVRAGLFQLVDLVDALSSDLREVWDLDQRLCVGELAVRAVTLLEQRIADPIFPRSE